MKVLNLDKLATKQKRQIELAGVAYPIEEMTVSNFIETTKVAQKIAGAPIAEQVEATIEMVMRSIPSISKETLSGLPLETLEAIVAFVRGEAVEGEEVVTAEEAAEKK